MNVFAPTGYDELITRLAFGVEPIDGQHGGRIAGTLRVTFDERTKPIEKWRCSRLG